MVLTTLMSEKLPIGMSRPPAFETASVNCRKRASLCQTILALSMSCRAVGFLVQMVHKVQNGPTGMSMNRWKLGPGGLLASIESKELSSWGISITSSSDSDGISFAVTSPEFLGIKITESADHKDNREDKGNMSSSTVYARGREVKSG